jgi:phosphatidylinositol glycan class A protein
MYSWSNVAERTERVYQRVVKAPQLSLADRLERYHGCGVFAGKLAVMIMAVDYLIFLLLEWLYPRDRIDIAPTLDPELFKNYCTRLYQKKQ